MKTKIYGLVMMVSVLLMVIGCETNNPSGEGAVECPEYIELPTAGGETTITITAKAAWKAAANKDWISLDPTKGPKGENEVTIAIKAGSEDSGLIMFKLEDGSKSKMTVYRGKKPAGPDPEDPEDPDEGEISNIGNGISVYFDELHVPLEGMASVIRVTSNSAWTATTNRDWLKVEPASKSGSSETQILVDYNYDKVSDVGIITFKNETGVAKMRIRRSNVSQWDETGEMDFSKMKKPDTSVEGCLPGLFAVGNNKLVAFSKGNLQYHPGKHRWRFPDHQYDVNPQGNSKSDYWTEDEDYIDLFAWAANGWSGGIKAYNPTDYYEYYNNHSAYWIAGDYKNRMTGEYANADWGIYNSIGGGGGQPGLWRTPEMEEMWYLIAHRPGSHNLIGMGTVCGVGGTILLPNNWQLPAGLSFQPMSILGGEYDDNIYDAAEWKQMEAAGAVFLCGGTYWTSNTAYEEDINPQKYAQTFSGTSSGQNENRSERYCVRLLRNW